MKDKILLRFHLYNVYHRIQKEIRIMQNRPNKKNFNDPMDLDGTETKGVDNLVNAMNELAVEPDEFVRGMQGINEYGSMMSFNQIASLRFSPGQSPPVNSSDFDVSKKNLSQKKR